MSIKTVIQFGFRWGGENSFGFFSVGFACRQKPNVLECVLAFQHGTQRLVYEK